MKVNPWICEACGEICKSEVDLLAHQFNSPCEKDLETRAAENDTRHNKAVETTGAN